jgi:hemerythrin-like domain-containing protein
MKSTTFLMEEHKLILRALDVLDEMSATAENVSKAEERDIDSILDFLRWFGDAHHQAKEEAILFPAIIAAAGTRVAAVQHAAVEHGQERALIEDMEKALRLKKLPDFVSCANRLSSTLRNHIYKEEQILFPLAAAMLDGPSDEAVLQRLDGFKTALDDDVLAEELLELPVLEGKYLRKEIGQKGQAV